MEQLKLIAREALRVRLPQEVRDELLSRMVEAIVVIFRTETRESHELVTSKDPS